MDGVKKKPNGGSFVKGDPRIAPIKRRLEGAAPPPSSETEGMLAAMRHVVTKPASEDRTFEQKEYRKWLSKDRKGFLSKKADLERAELGAKAKEQSSGVPNGAPDEGSERVEGLIEELLQKAREQ